MAKVAKADEGDIRLSDGSLAGRGPPAACHLMRLTQKRDNRGNRAKVISKSID
jgi:hypothetical protein